MANFALVLIGAADGSAPLDMGPGCKSPVTAFVHESFTAPPQIEIGPIGDWHDLTHINTGMTMPLKSQSVAWKSDGAEVQGWLLMPEKSDGKLPLITMVHGGPAGAWRPRFYGPGLFRADLLSGHSIRRGFSVRPAHRIRRG